MAGVTFDKIRHQWKVSWYRAPRVRTSRRFATEAEALAFVPPDEVSRASATGRYRGGRRRTRDEVLHFLADNFQIDDSGCWVWTNTLTNEGYGRLNWKESDDHAVVSGAHRLSLHVAVEPVPTGKVTDHLCRNRACINPDHLEVVQQRENVMRSPIAPGAINARKTHCAKGHPYSPENTYVYTHKTRSTTTRACKTCQHAYYVARRAARMGATA